MSRTPLPTAPPGHFWRPGSEKWREYLGPRHIEIVRASPLVELAAAFGYDMDLSDVGEVRPERRKTVNWSTVAAHDHRYAAIMGKRAVVDHPLVTASRNADGVFAVVEETGDANDQYGSATRRLLESAPLQDVLSCAYLDPSSCPPLLPDVIGAWAACSQGSRP